MVEEALMAVMVTRADGAHRLDGDHGLVEIGNRWLAHLEARNYSPATVRGYAFDLVSLGRFLEHAGIDWTELVPSDVFDWLEWQARPVSSADERVVRIGKSRGAAPSTTMPSASMSTTGSGAFRTSCVSSRGFSDVAAALKPLTAATGPER